MQSQAITYAIGDIHGCIRPLDELLARIADHAGERPRRLVFLGDYIDRGPDSAAVLHRIARLRVAEPDAVTCLMGNHERMFLDGLGALDDARHWRASGGDQTLASFGVRHLHDVPQDVSNWIAALPTLHGDGLRWFVHAGLRPGRSAEDTDDHDRLWIRGPFLEGDHEFGGHVVHGHTPQRSGQPDTRRFRTNLDTAAVYGGALTAGVFTDVDGPPREFIQVWA